MKHAFRSLCAAAALLGSVVALQAETALKIVTIDMEQLFEKYYRTEEEKAKMAESEKKAKEQLEVFSKDREALVTEAKDLQEQTKSPVLTDEARKKAQADLEAKVSELRSKDAEAQDFLQKTQQLFQKRMGQFQQMAVEEISKEATKIAKAKGATMVLNQGAAAVVVYADASFSITEEVLAAINKNRPAPAINVTVPPAK